MRIPRDFDRWMFDYKEGNLSPSEISYFENHIAQNPQLDADVDAWDNSYIKSEHVAYAGANSLIKTNKFGLYFGWAATIALLIGSFLGTYSLLNSDANNIYSLRDRFENSNYAYNSTNSSNEHFELNTNISKQSRNSKNNTKNSITKTNSFFIDYSKKSKSNKTLSQDIKYLKKWKAQNNNNLNHKKNSHHNLNLAKIELNKINPSLTHKNLNIALSISGCLIIL